MAKQTAAAAAAAAALAAATAEAVGAADPAETVAAATAAAAVYATAKRPMDSANASVAAGVQPVRLVVSKSGASTPPTQGSKIHFRSLEHTRTGAVTGHSLGWTVRRA